VVRRICSEPRVKKRPRLTGWPGLHSRNQPVVQSAAAHGQKSELRLGGIGSGARGGRNSCRDNRIEIVRRMRPRHGLAGRTAARWRLLTGENRAEGAGRGRLGRERTFVSNHFLIDTGVQSRLTEQEDNRAIIALIRALTGAEQGARTATKISHAAPGLCVSRMRLTAAPSAVVDSAPEPKALRWPRHLSRRPCIAPVPRRSCGR
jgi:hypothetical protein